jgi:hypothetical protein
MKLRNCVMKKDFPEYNWIRDFIEEVNRYCEETRMDIYDIRELPNTVETNLAYNLKKIIKKYGISMN